MSRIDGVLKGMTKYGATSALLESGTNVRLGFPTGERVTSHKLEHEDLIDMVQEVVPDDAGASLMRDEGTAFVYELEGKAYTIEVQPRGTTWMVNIVPKDGGPAAPSKPRAPAAAAPAARPGSPPRQVALLSKKPEASPGTWTIDGLLHHMNDVGASDLHLSTNAPPHLRLHGDMVPLPRFEPLPAEEVWDQLRLVIPDKNLQEYEERNDTDFAYEVEGLARFRANVFRDRHGPGGVFRVIPFEVMAPEQLGLPREVIQLCYLTKGLVLVTGPTGSGKSTTLAALVDYINRNRNDHIITIEDPIEFVHNNNKCLINQREVHLHTTSFKHALRAALREDPDIVLVGEMRDLETIAIAVETAETGHLVFGTLHTTTAPTTVDRIIDQFPADRQDQIRQMVSESLRGVIAQTLCRRIGGGRVAAFEILLGNSAVSNLIREKKTFQLRSLMQTARAQGMRTMGDSLIGLVKQGLIEPKEAYMRAVDKLELKTLLERNGLRLDIADLET